MKIILIFLSLLLIMIILRLFIVEEGFKNTALNPVTIQAYNKFLNFYNPFCDNWKKAIISSVASEIPQQPATDPANPTAGGAPDISVTQMNEYITTLSNKLSQPLPPICSTLPPTIDSTNIVEVTLQIPTDVMLFVNALNWMNPLLKESQANLGSALQGNSLLKENFEDICQDIASCLTNDPKLIQQIAIELSEQNDEQIIVEQEKLMVAINPFFTDSNLLDAFGENQILMKKAQEIQDQAQSGDLINQINVPGGRTIAKYELPPGANKFNDMKQNNPERYNEIKQNFSQWTTLKGMFDDINANL